MPVVRNMPRVLVLLCLIFGVGCKCPSWWSSNCSLQVRFTLPGDADQINGGNALQVSVVLIQGSDTETAELTSNQWLREDKLITERPRHCISFRVRGGEVELSGPDSDRINRAVVSADKKRIDLSFHDLGNPEDGGYADLLIFADYSAQLNEKALLVKRDIVQAEDWGLAFELQANQVIQAWSR